jgi:RNA polymerase sigma-70 factor (ECF subfamily)
LATSGILATAPETDSAERLALLFDLHRDRLFRLACRLSADREEARDLVQEAFVRAARSPRSLPASASGGEAWLVRTLVNLCRDRYRRVAVRERERQVLVRESRPATAHPEDSAFLRSAVRAALQRLPARRRAVVVLCEIEGVDAREAARLLGLSEVTIRWHRMQARRQLAKELAP